jgi:hypothetical protein
MRNVVTQSFIVQSVSASGEPQAVMPSVLWVVAIGLFPYERQLKMSTEPTSKQSQTDWQRLDAMTDEDIDLSDFPEITPEQFARGVVRRGLPMDRNKHPSKRMGRGSPEN